MSAPRAAHCESSDRANRGVQNRDWVARNRNNRIGQGSQDWNQEYGSRNWPRNDGYQRSQRRGRDAEGKIPIRDENEGALTYAQRIQGHIEVLESDSENRVFTGGGVGRKYCTFKYVDRNDIEHCDEIMSHPPSTFGRYADWDAPHDFSPREGWREQISEKDNHIVGFGKYKEQTYDYA